MSYAIPSRAQGLHFPSPLTHASARKISEKEEARARSRYASGRAENEDGRAERTGPHADNSDTLNSDARPAIDRCGELLRVAVGLRVSLFALHVSSIHSAEKGKKGQVVAASEVWGLGRPWRLPLRFVTFPFCRLPTLPPAALSFSLEPFSSLPRLLLLRAFRSNTHDSSENRRPAPNRHIPLRILPDHRLAALRNLPRT